MEWPKILLENGTAPHGSDQTTDSVFCNQQTIFLGRKQDSGYSRETKQCQTPSWKAEKRFHKHRN